MDDQPNNYARRLRSRERNEVIVFRSEDGLPERVDANCSDWVIWDLRPFGWRSALHRVGEDADAREARMGGISGYTSPLPPGQAVGSEVVVPYRRLTFKSRVE